jgi:deoxyadenosine/deoxycytidine kinase
MKNKILILSILILFSSEIFGTTLYNGNFLPIIDKKDTASFVLDSLYGKWQICSIIEATVKNNKDEEINEETQTAFNVCPQIIFYKNMDGIVILSGRTEKIEWRINDRNLIIENIGDSLIESPFILSKNYKMFFYKDKKNRYLELELKIKDINGSYSYILRR